MGCGSIPRSSGRRRLAPAGLHACESKSWPAAHAGVTRCGGGGGLGAGDARRLGGDFIGACVSPWCGAHA
jgi:hypothetical protein